MPLGGLTDEIDVKVYRSHVKIPLIFLVPAAFVATLYVALYLYANSGWFVEDLTQTLHEQMGGHFAVEELVVDPNLTGVHLYGAKVQAPDHSPVIDAEEVYASVRPLVLLTKRISFDEAYARGAHVHLRFDEEGNFGLFKALGLGDSDESDDADEPSGLSVEFSDIELVDSKLSYVMPDFDFHVPDLNLPKGSISIEPETLLMRVDRLDVPQIDFNFTNDLVRMPEEYGDWQFTVEDTKIREWRWANDGFTVDTLAFYIEGAQVEAGGQMNFPGGDGPDAQVMTYDGVGSLSVPLWSPLSQYFIRDAVHFEVPEFQIAARGSLEQIDGAAKLRASLIEAAGLYFEDVQATLALRNQWLDITEASAKVHGGELEVPEAYFNIFSVQYGGEGSFEGVNPRSLLNDFEVDLPWLDGRASGGFEVHGGVPLEREPARLGPLGLRDYARQKYAEVTATEDWVLERHNQLLAPASTAVLREGATTWVNMDRVVVPQARLGLDGDNILVDDLRLDYHTLTFENGPDQKPARASAYIQDVGSWASLYGLQAVEGPIVAQATVEGPLASPDLTLDVRNRQAPIRFAGAPVAADDLHLRLALRRGRLTIEQAAVATRLGRARASGWIDLLEADPDLSRGGESAFALRRVQPANLEFSSEDVDLGAVAELFDVGVPVSGTFSSKGALTGTLQKPNARLEAAIDRAEVFGQSIPRVRMRGGLEDDRVVLDALELDAAGAGRFYADGYLGFDESYEFRLDGSDISFSQIAPFELLPSSARPRGRAQLSLHGEGSLAEPGLGGNLQLYEVAVGDRQIGDAALVVNAVDDSIYIEGAVLPLATVRVQIPLDAESPYYARLGVEELDLTRAVSELGDSSVLSKATVTGMVELFLEKDFSRYQILSYLTQLEVESSDRTIKNRGPLVFGLNNGEILQIQQATIGTGDRYVSVDGAVVLDPLLLDVTLDGQLDLSMLNAARRTFPDVFPTVLLDSRGLLDVGASFRGTLDSLVADGRVAFQGAEFALRGLPEPVTVSSGTVQLEPERIHVSDDAPLTGSALGGVFNVAGELGFEGRKPGALEVRAWSHNMNYRVPNTANLTFDTDLRLEARDVRRPETWLVSGSADVLDGNFYRDISLFEQEVTGRVLGAFNRRTERYEASIFDQIPALEDIRFDLAVRARDGFEIRNQIDRLGLDLELRVDLRLRDTLLEPYVTGDIEASGGTVSFQGEDFEVRSGTVRFTGAPKNPWIDVSAGADIRNRCRDDQLADDFQTDMTLSGNLDDNEEQYYHVLLNLQGYADNLDIQFDSNPYADQRDILSLLLTGCTVDQLTASSASGPTLEIALGPLLGRIEKEIQDVVKVSEFTIMPGVERTQVRIGDRLTRRLSWNFQLDTGMAETSGGQRYQLEYKLSDRWSAEMSERSQTETNNFLLDLKLKYRVPLN